MLFLLRNARLFSPADQGVVDLVVADGRVVHVGTELDALPAWSGGREYELGGRTVVPAFVDGHVHVTGGGGEAGYGSRIAPLSPAAFRAAGCGTVVGLLGTDDTTRSIEDLVGWTRHLGANGVTAFCFTGGYHVPVRTLTGSVRGDIVWLDSVLGVGEVAISDHRGSAPSIAELTRLAADAHVAGLMTGKAGILHLHVGDAAAGLEPVRQVLANSDIPPRTLQPTHVNRRKQLLDEAIALSAAGCTIDITAFPVADDEDAWSAATAARIYLESGADRGRVTVSSDGGGCLPVFDADGQVTGYATAASDTLLQYLRESVAADLTLAQALPPVTLNPAKLLRLHRKGRLAPGSDADLLVLDASLGLEVAMFGGRWSDSAGQFLGEAGIAGVLG